MINFKGFDEWIEVFKGGRQVDSQGREHNGNRIIDKAIETFNPEEHEPPIVVGHPKDNGPAYGWIEGLKSSFKDEVKVLLVKCKQVVPEFEEMVKSGLFKKRSASFYPDGRLRHVGFLGAMPPAVKGLQDMGFNSGDDSAAFCFSEPDLSFEEQEALGESIASKVNHEPVSEFDEGNISDKDRLTQIGESIASRVN